MDIGYRLKQFRLERHLTLETVSKAIGISKAALSQYENNINDPSLKILESLLDFYCIDKEAFLFTKKECIDISFYSEIDKEKAIALHKKELQKFNSNSNKK